MDRIEAFSRVANRLQEAALAPDSWPRALQGLVEFVKGDQAVILATDAHHAPPTLAAAVAVDADHARNCLSLDLGYPRPLILPRSPLGAVFSRTAFFSNREFERSALYERVMRPSKAFYALHARARRASADFVLHLCRARSAGDFEASDAAMLRRLLPHLGAALEIQERFETASNGQASFVRALDSLKTGVMLADAKARLIFANEAAARTLAETDGLAAYESGLVASTPAATLRLRERIAAVGADSAIASQRMRLDRPSQRAPLLLTFTPIFRLGVIVAGARAPRAAIFIKEMDTPTTLDTPALAETFRLTARECEVAALLAHGRDMREIAIALGLGVGTVRHHLKRIFHKTGANGQAKLVALLRNFIDPLR